MPEDTSENIPENPYESPQTEANAVNPLSGRVLTENMLFYLRGASPWLRFVGMVGFVFLGIVLVGLLAIIIGFDSFSNALGMGSLGSFVFVVYLPGLIITFFLVFFTYRFGKRIQAYLHTGDSGYLEDAFKNNKSLWTLAGVLIIIILAIFALVLISIIITAVAAASQF